MSLRRWLILYLALLHLAAGILGGALLWPGRRGWIVALEAGLVASLAAGAWLIARLSLPRRMVELGTDWLKEGDFGHHFRPTGLADLDGLIGLYNEMVARLRQERTLLEERGLFLEQLVTASPSGIVITDHDGRIERLSPAAAVLLDLDPGAAAGRRPEEIPGPLLAQMAVIPVGASEIIGRRGHRRLKCTHAQFLDRSFPRRFYILEDLTHELWATEKLAYHSLIRTLSHEVNNSLGATNSLLESALVYGSQLRSEDRADFVEALQVAIQRTSHLVAFMRRYAEVARVPRPNPRPAELLPVLQSITRLMEAECRERRIRLSLSVSGRMPEVAMDVALMEQVFVNVLRNSVEAIGRDGDIAVRICEQDGRPAVAVEDSGPGLAPEAEANLFTPFFSTKPDGQGVGLTLVQEILTLHGFGFALESPPGGPTRFLIVFDTRPEG